MQNEHTYDYFFICHRSFGRVKSCPDSGIHGFQFNSNLQRPFKQKRQLGMQAALICIRTGSLKEELAG